MIFSQKITSSYLVHSLIFCLKIPNYIIANGIFTPDFYNFFVQLQIFQMNHQRQLMFFNSVNSLIVDLETAFGLEHWSVAHFKFHQFFLIIISSITRNTSPLTHFYLDQEKLQLLLKSKVMYPRADTDWFAVWPITYISLDGREICIRRLKISVANSRAFLIDWGQYSSA